MKTKLLLFLLIFTIAETNAQQIIHDFSDQSESANFIELNNLFFFEHYNETYGNEIWVSDGTNSNTKLLKDINPGTGSSSSNLALNSAILNGKCYFMAKDASSSGEIWQTDGSEAGTFKITNSVNGRTSKIIAVGNFLFFVIKKEDNKIELWKTDGSVNGEILVKEMPVAGNPSFQGKCNNTLILTFNFNGDNSKVWRSDGTSDGTFAITEAMDGNGSAPAGTSDLSQYVEYNNKLYFVNRYYLYETDGTLENTNKVASLWNAQHDTLAFSDVIEVDNKLYFMFFSDTLNKLSIFKYDPALGISSEIYTNLGSQYFSPSHFAKGNNALLFTASNQNGGTSLISLDLTTGNASDLKELSDKNTTKKPFGFMEYLDATNIYKINSDEYYIKTAVTDYNRNGWILDAKLKTVENIEGFYNVWFSIVFNESLYYSKDSKLYKYANTLSTVNNQTKPLLKLFPNPSADFIQLNTGDTDDVENISIYDLSGKKVLNISNYNNGKIDISKLSQGIYNIQIRSNGSLISKKIIKK